MRQRRLAVVHDYAGLVAVLRARADKLDVSNLTIDEVAGLQEGYTSKLLAPNPIRRLGITSLPLVLGALGLALAVVEDREQLARIRSRLSKRSTLGRRRGRLAGAETPRLLLDRRRAKGTLRAEGGKA
jgi:hypothetical protein